MRKILTICLALIGFGVGGAVLAQTIGSVSVRTRRSCQSAMRLNFGPSFGVRFIPKPG